MRQARRTRWRNRQRSWGLVLAVGGAVLPVAECSLGAPLAGLLLEVGLLPLDAQAPIGYFLCIMPLLALGLLAGGLTLLMTLPPPPPDPGVCATCGYSLTGNTSGVCPECGRTVDAASRQ